MERQGVMLGFSGELEKVVQGPVVFKKNWGQKLRGRARIYGE